MTTDVELVQRTQAVAEQIGRTILDADDCREISWAQVLCAAWPPAATLIAAQLAAEQGLDYERPSITPTRPAERTARSTPPVLPPTPDGWAVSKNGRSWTRRYGRQLGVITPCDDGSFGASIAPARGGHDWTALGWHDTADDAIAAVADAAA